MRHACTLTFAFGFTLAGLAQTQPPSQLPLFHPTGASLSYEVATIKLLDPNTAASVVKLPPGVFLSPLSMRRYIMDAYGAIYSAQIIGGPDWLNKDPYQINGKIPDDLKVAMQKMKRDDRLNQTHNMQQSLLADRFHLKAHFETRILPVYELAPAKGGLKFTDVPAPPERKPDDPPLHLMPGDPIPPGTSMTSFNSAGLRILNARAIKMQLLARIIGSDIGDRPILDATGFTGYFDITDLEWAPIGQANADTSADTASLPVALGEKLGIKINATKGPVEVLVIDSIDRPTPN